VTDAAYQRGVQFLISSQLEDGSWYVRSRAIRTPYSKPCSGQSKLCLEVLNRIAIERLPQLLRQAMAHGVFRPLARA
jgi:hypothetical protein